MILRFVMPCIFTLNNMHAKDVAQPDSAVAQADLSRHCLLYTCRVSKLVFSKYSQLLVVRTLMAQNTLLKEHSLDHLLNSKFVIA